MNFESACALVAQHYKDLAPLEVDMGLPIDESALVQVTRSIEILSDYLAETDSGYPYFTTDYTFDEMEHHLATTAANCIRAIQALHEKHLPGVLPDLP